MKLFKMWTSVGLGISKMATTLAQRTIIPFGKILCPRQTIEVATNSHFLGWIFILTLWTSWITSQDEPSDAWIPCYALGRHLCSTLGNMPFQKHGPWLAKRRYVHSKRHHKPFPKLAILRSKHNLVEALPQIHNCEDVWVSNVIKQFFNDGHGVHVLRFNQVQRPIIPAHPFCSP